MIPIKFLTNRGAEHKALDPFMNSQSTQIQPNGI